METGHLTFLGWPQKIQNPNIRKIMIELNSLS